MKEPTRLRRCYTHNKGYQVIWKWVIKPEVFHCDTLFSQVQLAAVRVCTHTDWMSECLPRLLSVVSEEEEGLFKEAAEVVSLPLLKATSFIFWRVRMKRSIWTNRPRNKVKRNDVRPSNLQICGRTHAHLHGPGVVLAVAVPVASIYHKRLVAVM